MKKNMPIRRTGRFMALILAVFVLAAAAEAAPAHSSAKTSAAKKKSPPAVKKEKTVEKTVSGSVVFVRKNNMSVELAAPDEEGGREILLSIDPEVQLRNVKKLSDLRYGDQVTLRYLQTYLPAEEKGKEPVYLSYAVKEVTFMNRPDPAGPGAAA